MTTTIIIIICIVLLIAYIFDLTSHRTKIPSVILLLLFGYILKQITNSLNVELPNVDVMLPVFGTVGLILIVLEGSLELELNKSKIRIIEKSAYGSFITLFALSFTFAFMFQYYGHASPKDCLINAIPLAVISSAVAIPSARNLLNKHREFITYESSLSDIFGVLLFNFIALNDHIGFHAFGSFIIELISIILISFISSLGISLLLTKIDHHIKFIPIMVLVILIYSVSKVFHLPALVFILIFGIFLGNLDEFKRFKWIEIFKPDELDKEVKKFKELTIEATFLIRALFFILFGYSLKASDILNPETLVWAVGIVLMIFAFRAAQLELSKLPLTPLLFLAPRGLITVLLYLSIDQSQRILLVNKSLIIQVIILTALVMMVGLLFSKKVKQTIEIR